MFLALALADPRLSSHSDQVNVFFCLDTSESISMDQRVKAEEFIKTAGSGMGADDQAGLIVFGKHPSLEMSLRPDFDSGVIRSDVNPNYTNIYEALQLAIGKFPQQGQNKIVVFSDGNENIGHAMDMANLAGSLGIGIYPVPMITWFDKNEAFIQSLETPPDIALQTPFRIRLVIASSTDSQGELVLVRNDNLLTRQALQLSPGINVVTFTDTIVDPGLYLYRALINSADDTFSQNNEGLSFTRATRKSHILYLTDEYRHMNHLSEMLKAQGLSIVHQNNFTLAIG